jgi:hypothetical protein
MYSILNPTLNEKMLTAYTNAYWAYEPPLEPTGVGQLETVFLTFHEIDGHLLPPVLKPYPIEKD